MGDVFIITFYVKGLKDCSGVEREGYNLFKMASLEDLMNLSPDVEDYKAAMAARSAKTNDAEIKNPNEPFGLSTVRKIHSEQNSRGNWLENILSLMHFPDPLISRENLSVFNSSRMVRLVGVLEADATLEVNFDRMIRANLITQLSLF